MKIKKYTFSRIRAVQDNIGSSEGARRERGRGREREGRERKGEREGKEHVGERVVM